MAIFDLGSKKPTAKPGGAASAEGGAAAGAAAQGDVIAVTDASFMQDVMEQSKTRPVIVDFWAPWCGPCKQLIPLLEKHVTAAKGKVRLAKINTDENQAIAQQLGVRSIPAVFVVDKGQIYKGFTGALPDSQVKQFVERLAASVQEPEPEEDGLDALLERADAALGAGDIGEAGQDFAVALELEPENLRAIIGLARCHLALGDIERAEGQLVLVPEDKAKDASLQGLRAAIDIAKDSRDAGDPQSLAAALASAPNDHAQRFALARALAGRGQVAAAMEELLTIIRANREWNEGAARNFLLKIFEAAGHGSELAKEGRRRLSTILHA